MSRSYLFIPGNTPGMIQNLDIFESDAVIIDFEDSVIDYDKDAARQLIRSFLSQYPQDKLDVYIRINDVDSAFFAADLAYTKDLSIRGYVLPKASIGAVDMLAKRTNKDILPIIESPLAVLDARDIVRHPQVTGLLLGAEDLTREMAIERSTDGLEIEYVRSHLAIVCHAHHKAFVDTPWTHKDDVEGLHNDALLAKRLGATGKAAIHPNHVSVINDVFTPSQEAVRLAKRIVAKAAETGKGAFTLDGKMVDAPIIDKAKKLLETAKRYHIE